MMGRFVGGCDNAIDEDDEERPSWFSPSFRVSRFMFVT